MNERIKHVARLNVWIDPGFDELISSRSDIALTVCDADSSDGNARKALSQTNIYHISAAKDEVPSQWLVTASLLKQCPDLLCVSSSGAGYDTIDVKACTAAGVLVVNQAGGNAQSVAEHVFGLMLGLTRRIVESNDRLRHDRGFSREDLMGSELSGKTLGLVGLGHIGTRVARMAPAFGLKVMATDPYLSSDEIARRGAIAMPLDDLLQQADIVSLHCPLTAQTASLFDSAAFSKMKTGSYFITTARGGIHDEESLCEALTSGHLSGAGLDVWAVEPPLPDHPLLALRNVIGTYHTAGVTHEARHNVATMAAGQILQLCDGVCPECVVNPQVIPIFARRYESFAGKTLHAS